MATSVTISWVIYIDRVILSIEILGKRDFKRSWSIVVGHIDIPTYTRPGTLWTKTVVIVGGNPLGIAVIPEVPDA